MNTNQQSHSCARSDREVNIGETERVVSLVVGGALAVKALQRMDVISLGLVALGAGLIFRGATGHCGLYKLLDTHGTSSAPTDEREKRTRQTADELRAMEDVVGEASIESFPASDPPAWTSSTAMPMPAGKPRVAS